MSLLPMEPGQHVLLADDDKDDCMLFKDALEELNIPSRLTTVYNGEQLMGYLEKHNSVLPDILFLDLNMPKKNGIECLSEIKANEKLKQLRVILFSTSFDNIITSLLYKQGAQNCILKPNEFSKLKELIRKELTDTAPR